MTNILHIAASPNVTDSKSRQAAAIAIAKMTGTVTTRDLAQNPLPQITQDWNAARLVPFEDRSPGHHAALSLSDTLIAEVRDADIIVIGMPMYNFGVPAALKAWIDLICRPKVTFAYTPNGVRGLLHGKSAVIVAASGGTRVDDPQDFATPHLRHVLGFIGITEVTTLLAKDIIAADS